MLWQDEWTTLAIKNLLNLFSLYIIYHIELVWKGSVYLQIYIKMLGLSMTKCNGTLGELGFNKSLVSIQMNLRWLIRYVDYSIQIGKRITIFVH